MSFSGSFRALAVLSILVCVILGGLAQPVRAAKNASSISSGEALMKKGEFQNAINVLSKGLKSGDNESARYHCLLGECYLKTKKYRKARKHLRIAIRRGHGSSYCQRANKAILKLPKKYIQPRTGPDTRLLAALFGFINRHRGPGAPPPKPTVIDFYASWCQPCKKLDQVLTSYKQRYGEKIAFKKVDVDDPRNDRILDQYEVSPIPTVVFLNEEGEVVTYSIGFSGEKALSQGFNKILTDGNAPENG